MVSAAVAKSANADLLPNSLPQDFTAVFVGATSGIGRSALEHLATVSKGKSPRLYVIGRSATAAAPLIASLRQANPSASVEFIEKDVSLVKSVDEVASIIKKNESKVDLLFLSPGFLPFEGRRGR
jgi:short-subunit dehydrogenase